MMANLIEAISRHHRARIPIKFTAPRKMIPVEIDSEFAAGGIQNANTLWYHFLANPVAGNGRDTIALHWSQKIGRNTVGRKLIRSTPDRLEPLAIASKCFAISILRLVGKPSVKEQIKGSAQ